MLIAVLAACGLVAAGPPVDLPEGWTCEGPTHGAWVCSNPDAPGYGINFGVLTDWSAGHASSRCTLSGSLDCVRSRVVIGDLVTDTLAVRLDGGHVYATVFGKNDPEPVEIWTVADEFLPQVRFHAVEAVCQRETGKPCEVTFGPMELQPNGDPRAVAK